MIEIIKRNGSIAVLIMVFLLINLPDGKSQKVELSPFFGYQTGARFSGKDNGMRIGGGIDYGISLNYAVSLKWRLEISYNNAKSDISFPANSIEDRNNYNKYTDLRCRFFSLGGLRELSPGNKANPFGILSVGWVHYHPTSHGYTNEDLLHFSLGGGVKLAVTDNFGFRFQTRLIIPVWFAGDYFTSIYSEGLLRPSHTTFAVQGDLTLSAILVLDKRHERK